MKFTKKILGATVFALASLSAHAAPINVGGVTWDPAWVDGGEQDFAMKYDFTQWFSTTSAGNNNVANMQTSYTTAIGINTLLSTLNGSNTATGYFLSGVGETYYINGSTSFCTGCELTLAFGGLGLNNNNTFDITNAWINLYVDFTADYTSPTSNVGEVASAMDGNLWLSASVLSFGLTSGTVQNALASAQFQVTGGLAANNFLNSPKAGFANQSGSAFFNTSINAKFSSLGNGQVVSETIPEPASLAIFGLGLIGLAGMARRKTKKS
ncbi:hypothetical protein VT06_00440 [Arsukibacterium sp. MJ3]|uniref:PEP-CTERM sorting domain-containing protein n=1 Tax=Arsukibacterium sp. MJ3 TaxID=1632859 RepID=UPI00062712EF|nr:PEP-CTERM sorting domain-containing protein [Arsukibacterium sp. MJ3]KKO50496.1 hypothetical protein VT06_00440 [Arsukibacterium sp. MJ3]